MAQKIPPTPPTDDRETGSLAQDLRCRAEERVIGKFALLKQEAGRLSPEEVRTLVQELQVHQIELEMQNEELRRAHAELEASRERYYDLYDLAPAAYLTVSEQGLVLESNFTAAGLLGVQRGALTDRPFSQFILPADQDIYYLHRKKLFATGDAQSPQLRLLRSDGTHFWARLDANAAWDETAQKTVGRIIISDVSEHKQLEDTLTFLSRSGYQHADEDFFHSLARFLAQSLDVDFVCIDRLLADGLTARTLSLFFDGKFDDNIEYALKDTPCGEVVGKAICCFPRDVRRLFPRDAVLREMGAEGYAGCTLWGFDGNPIGLIALIGRKPLTNPRLAEATLTLVAVRAAGELERRRVEEALKLHATKLTESNRELDAFSTAVSGEVGIPLRAIRGFSEQLLRTRAETLDAEALGYLNVIHDSSAQLTDRLEDLLTMSRLSHHEIRFVTLDPTAIFRAAFDKLLAAEPGREVVFTLSDLPPGRGDGALVQQIVVSLLGNALKFTRGLKPATITVTGRRDGEMTVYTVADNGIGFNPQYHDRMFSIFTRLNDQHGGAGVGLALAKRAAARLGGQVWAESAIGAGAAFHFSLLSP